MQLHEHDIKRILAAYLDGSATSDEKEILERFFNENKDEALKENLSPEEFRFLERRLKEKIDQHLHSDRDRMPAFYRVAAVVSFLVLVSYIYFSLRTTQQVVVPDRVATLVRSTERGQKITIKLPDGTSVKLNSNSKLSFPEKFRATSREVILEGEGYFDVTHSASVPFIVHTKNSSTKVLGTSFNVNDKNETRTEVTLVTGKVSVSGNEKPQRIDLKPHQQAIIKTGANVIDTSSVDVSRFIEWKDDILRFERKPLSQVIIQLEDWYGVDIAIKNKAIEGCLITGKYESETLENVLKSFQFMLKGNYTMTGKKITLTGKECSEKF
jgi:transmembrane sensor